MGTILQIEESKALDTKLLITCNPPMRHPVTETDICENVLSTQPLEIHMVSKGPNMVTCISSLLLPFESN